MNPKERPLKIELGDTSLVVPIYFPSISTVKTTLEPLIYMQILNALKNVNSQFLISAFDLFHASVDDKVEMKRLISEAKKAGVVVLMDSGNYESYWKNARETWGQANLKDVLQEWDSTFIFSYDEQEPPDDIHEHISLVTQRYLEDQSHAGGRPVVPIIHGNPETFPELCVGVARRTNAQIIAIPERRLGDGIFERAKTLAKIRETINSEDKYVGIHLLGTGNPISVALYAVVGADSFDGLEWCQTVVDHESGVLYHLSHADFFRGQTEWGETDLPFHVRVLAHNLDFYNDWMYRLRNSIADGRGIEFCRANFSREIYLKCAEAMGWPEQ